MNLEPPSGPGSRGVVQRAAVNGEKRPGGSLGTGGFPAPPERQRVRSVAMTDPRADLGRGLRASGRPGRPTLVNPARTRRLSRA